MRNSDRVVAPDTTPAADNIAAKPLLPHPPTNKPNVSLPLPITENLQEERIDSLENLGISSNQNSIPKQINIPPCVYNEEKVVDGYDTDDQIGNFLGAMEIEGTQIFEEEKAKPPVSVPVQINVESSTRIVLEVAAVAGASGPAPLAKQCITCVKEDLKLRCQPTQGNKKILIERLKDAMNRRLVQYSTLEEAKVNSKSKRKKTVGDGGGMKQICIEQFLSTAYWKVLKPETAVVSKQVNPQFKVARAPTITEVEAKYFLQK